jgi:hypothetical protein
MFPTEVLLRVAQHCELADVITLRAVSREIHEVAEEAVARHFRGPAQRARNLVEYPCQYTIGRFLPGTSRGLFLEWISRLERSVMWRTHTTLSSTRHGQRIAILLAYGGYDFISRHLQPRHVDPHRANQTIRSEYFSGSVNRAAIRWIMENWKPSVLFRDQSLGMVPGYIGHLLKHFATGFSASIMCSGRYVYRVRLIEAGIFFIIHHLLDLMTVIRRAGHIECMCPRNSFPGGAIQLELQHYKQKIKYQNIYTHEFILDQETIQMFGLHDFT